MIETPWALRDLLVFSCAPVGDAVREEQAVVGVLVVLDQQAAPRSVDRKVHHAVVMHAPLPGLVSGGVAGILLEHRPVRDGIAPGDEHFSRVPRRYHDCVGVRHRDALKAEQRPARSSATVLGRGGNGFQQRANAA